jgi:cellulose synthase/poly-beta-1,6-N-acetylglucosamine synthase-like glycosyltransferase
MSVFLPKVCARARTEVVISTVLFIVTMTAFVLFFVENYLNSQNVLSRFIPGTGTERVVYNLIFAVFMFGSFTYQVSRLSFFSRLRKRVRIAEENLQKFKERGPGAAPRVEILVPSYREEVHVIWQTLMSAALTDYPHRRIVLLLDNPPIPTDREERDVLLASRAQVDLINDMLAPIANRFAAVAEGLRATADLKVAAQTLAGLHDEAALWLEDVAVRVEGGAFSCPDDHTRKFFVRSILREPAEVHRQRAAHLRDVPQDVRQIEAEIGYLATRFKVEVALFERKRYANLSHAPTKAANLNAYLSIMGRRLAVIPRPKGLELVDQAERTDLDKVELLMPPDAMYVVILDADSFLLRDYVTHMIAAMDAPGNERAAVMQTPYTAIPDTPHVLERTAGATTDIYYHVTEGMGFANAGFWVGASATLRKQALLDIVTYHHERGYVFPVYIQDKTVIEDTGATIDLIRKGWSVENYPARLSYSTTPSDFGALVVQRRRWANGGLIILPNLLGYLLKRAPTPRNLIEGLLRIHYLVMPACISISMLLMLVYPFDFKRVSALIYVTLPPYLYLVCRDLKHTGYRWSDIFRAYALFLVLLPVVLTGVKNSIMQILFGIKAQFGRTPKIERRTAIPLTCAAAILALFGWSVSVFHTDMVRGDGLHAVFALSNVLALGYGIVAMIGLKEIGQDFAHAVSSFAVGLWRKMIPGRRRPEPVPVAEGLQLQLIPAELAPSLQAPSLQAPGTPESIAAATRHNANRLRHGTPLGSAAMPEVSNVPLQPTNGTPIPEDGKHRSGRRPIT